MLALVNAERKSHGLAELVISKSAVQSRSKEGAAWTVKL